MNTLAIPSDLHALYVGTDLGVYASTDLGTTWQLYGPTCPSRS
ncbi:MAG: hypothetical protein R3E12_04535 [Candidatus Eisenbacteria bacterium]